MCIAVLIFNYSPKFPLIVAHNREEDVDRPTSDLLVRDNILSARDLRAGGVAAMGLDIRSGRFGILTNCRFRGSQRPEGLSRGFILQKAIQSGLSNSLINNIKSETFQGDFHMYVGEAFISNQVVVNYITNIPGSPEAHFNITIDACAPLEVVVRMNEHPCSLDDWSEKIQYVRDLLESRLSADRNLESGEVLELIQSCLSEINEILPQVEKDFSWSPEPDLEHVALRHIVIPSTDIGICNFGTVSQTVMIVDAEERTVDYNYRLVSHAEGDVEFSSWRTCIVSFS